MYLRNNENNFAVALLISIWLLGASSCNGGPKIDRVSITPFVSPGQKAARLDMTATTNPAPLAPGQQAELAVDVTQRGSDLRVQWFTPQNKGHFISATDGLTTTFVAPNEPGPFELACHVMLNGETKIVHLPIVVTTQSVATPASESPAPERASLPASPQNAGPFDIDLGGFIPCGWMGDAEEGEKYLQVQDVGDRTPSGQTVSKWSFRPGGKEKWLAVGWQFGKCNWGDQKGKDLSGKGYKRVSFWVKGVPDTEQKLPMIQFKAGGNADPTKRYKASFLVQSDIITITSQWQEYHLDIRNEDLSSVISAFTVVLRSKDNERGATFYLGGITYNASN